MNKTEVFLSFKNSDANGNSTKERAMADELYNALANRGIGVFYSNETLSVCGAAQYKAEIDNALDEATILIAVGTSRESLESSWVRYEWDGFFNDVLSGQKEGHLFSYIDDMSPSDLPRTLRQLQRATALFFLHFSAVFSGFLSILIPFLTSCDPRPPHVFHTCLWHFMWSKAEPRRSCSGEGFVVFLMTIPSTR